MLLQLPLTPPCGIYPALCVYTEERNITTLARVSERRLRWSPRVRSVRERNSMQACGVARGFGPAQPDTHTQKNDDDDDLPGSCVVFFVRVTGRLLICASNHRKHGSLLCASRFAQPRSSCDFESGVERFLFSFCCLNKLPRCDPEPYRHTNPISFQKRHWHCCIQSSRWWNALLLWSRHLEAMCISGCRATEKLDYA